MSFYWSTFSRTGIRAALVETAPDYWGVYLDLKYGSQVVKIPKLVQDTFKVSKPYFPGVWERAANTLCYCITGFL